jgi:TolB-like protein/DNA-binding SARP family transcriptional activator
MQPLAESHAELKLRLLGTFSLSSAGQDIAVPGLRSRALLAFLACNAGKTYAREKLAGLLWSERFEEQARQSLRQTLTVLRKAIGSDLIDTDRGDVGLKETFSSDVSRFLALAATGDCDRLREAVALYQDDLLAGFSLEEKAFTDWLATERARLRDLALGALETLMEPADGDVAPARLLDYAQRAISIDPYREQAHRQLLRALVLAGRRNDALMHYRQLERRLQSDLGVQPEAATRAVFEAVRAGVIGLESAQPQSGEIAGPALPAPDGSQSAGKPTIAVLPFVNMSADTQQDFFSDGVTEDIITELSRFRQISVLARNTAFRYRDTGIEVKRVGRKLGVQYVVEGSIRRMGDRVRITAQLVDATSGNQLWAEHFDRDQREIFAVQDQVIRTIVGTLVGRLEAAGVEQIRRRPTTSLEAYECLLRAKALPLGNQRIEAERRALYERAIGLDPYYGLAHAFLAHAIYLEWFRDMTASDVALDHALELAKKAVALDDNEPTAHYELGWIYLSRKSFDLAEQYYQRALSLNPNSPGLFAHMSFLYAYTGRTDEALDALAQARLIDPYFSPTWYWHHLGYANFIARRYDEAIAALSHSTTMPFWVQAYLAACYALTDRMDRAQELRAEILRLVPDFSLTRLAAKEPFKHCTDRDHLVEGLRKAGLPGVTSTATN